MAKKMKKDYIEDATKYGEFVCTEFGWISPEKQKEAAEKMENISKKNNIKRKT